jgi:hypothetical protein
VKHSGLFTVLLLGLSSIAFRSCVQRLKIVIRGGQLPGQIPGNRPWRSSLNAAWVRGMASWQQSAASGSQNKNAAPPSAAWTCINGRPASQAETNEAIN